jgi:hypothetical protein
MNAKNLLVVLFLLAGCVPLSAQNTPPDLSGTWQLNLAKSKLPKHFKLDSQIISISCSGLSVGMHFITNGKESDRAMIADGKERTLNENDLRKLVFKAKWQGPVLITETTWIEDLTVTRYRESWTLSVDGRVLTVKQDDPRSLRIFEKVKEGPRRSVLE